MHPYANHIHGRIHPVRLPMAIRHITLLLLMLMALSLTSPSKAMAGEVAIAVAANFADVAHDIAAAFEKNTGHKTRLSFGSTGQLFAQITHGAPFEVFLAGDTVRPHKAVQEGLATDGSRFTYAIGTLVLVSMKSGLFEDGRSYLVSGNYRKLAIANPVTAPYGLAAKEVLLALDLWDEAHDKLVQGNSVAQAFQFVATGNADAGFAALSDVVAYEAMQGETLGSTWRIPVELHKPIEQQAVLLTRGKNNPAAHAFIKFLKSDEAREIIGLYGYLLP